MLRPGLSFEDQIMWLGERLKRDLPGIDAHLDMAPAARLAPEALSIAGKSCRKAAVLALLFPKSDTPHVLLTKRKHNLKKHAGQISFPGGKQEKNESLVETALRETQEEVGLFPHQIELIGSLSPIYINVSNFCVYPFVGSMPHTPVKLTPQDSEVERILKVPLHALADPAIEKRETWQINGHKMTVPFYDYDGETIWGATAMMLAELMRVVKDNS